MDQSFPKSPKVPLRPQDFRRHHAGVIRSIPLKPRAHIKLDIKEAAARVRRKLDLVQRVHRKIDLGQRAHTILMKI